MTKDSLEIGFDESGRGALFGPIVVGCVVLDLELTTPEFIRDSKVLTSQEREEAYIWIVRNSLYYGSYFISNREIDKKNINSLTGEAIARLHSSLPIEYSKAPSFIDYIKVSEIENSHSTTKAESKYLSVAAASIVAKVERDRYVKNLDPKYSVYGINTNVGYGTKKHREAIKKYGLSDLHRLKYKLK